MTERRLERMYSGRNGWRATLTLLFLVQHATFYYIEIMTLWKIELEQTKLWPKLSTIEYNCNE